MKKIQAFILALLILTGCALSPAYVYAEEEESTAEEQTDSESAEDSSENQAGKEETPGEQQQAAGGPEITAPSAILMETSTGTVLYEKDADTARPPASVTKVMTMLLIFDALEEGSIHLEDEVTTSEYAASMGGSQVFLEPGETQTVDTLLKCIAVASANDACVTMAEYICGSEEEFVNRMNESSGAGNDEYHFCEL